MRLKRSIGSYAMVYMISTIIWNLSVIGQQAMIELPDPVLRLGEPFQGVYFIVPYDCTSVGADTFYVLDFQDCVVSAINLQGELLFQFGRQGQGPGEFELPRSIIADDGLIYISDSRLNRISVFNYAGQFQQSVPTVYRPNQMIINRGYLYVGVHHNQEVVRRIRLENPDDQEAVVLYDEITDPLEAFARSDFPYLNLMNEQLYVGFPRTGKVKAYSLPDFHVTAEFQSPHDLVTPYLKYIDELNRSREGPGGYLPRVLLNMQIWKNRYLLLNVGWPRAQENASGTVVTLDVETGEEVNPRFTPSRRGFYFLKILSNGLQAWNSLDDAMIYIYKPIALGRYLPQ